jgi:hypothetical protein
VSVVVDGVSSAMAVELGNASQGTWFVTTPRSTACRSYYFTAVDADGGTWRFPASGKFRTRDEGTCVEEFTP